MIENILVSLAVTFLAGFPLSVYAGIVVSRYYIFEESVNRARSIILDMETEWTYAPLPQRIPDPSSETGMCSIYISKELSSNSIFWRLIQIGLDLKEQGHWKAASALDRVALELDGIREDVVERGVSTGESTSFDVTVHVADWHRRLSRVKPKLWLIFKPWPGKRYEKMSCVSVDEYTGEWSEEEPE